MKVLELFSGTGSVGKVCRELGFEVVSLDLKDADININILEWDYKQFEPGYFDVVWASPPCDTFSNLRKSWIGRKLKAHNGEVCSAELLQKDIDEIGLPILRQTEKIIDYLKPRFYFIENPQTGKMKEYISRPFYDVDYCMYSDWGYRKRTRIWTNLEGFKPKLCRNDCGNLIEGTKKHKVGMGNKKHVIDETGVLIKVNTPELKEQYKDQKTIITYLGGKGNIINLRYRIPPLLIKCLIMGVIENNITKINVKID
jgi:hypothetical protein